MPEPRTDSTTRHVRVSGDLATKLGEILEVERVSSAEFLDPLIRTEIENRHRANMPAIKILRNARERAARVGRDEPASALGGEG